MNAMFRVVFLPRVWAGMAVFAAASAWAQAAATVDYNRQIRPILSDACFRCHGPDATHRQGGLRLDVSDAPLQPADSGAAAIIPGKPDESELVRRILSADASEVMPPPDSDRQLKPEEKEVLKTWVAQGARFQTHWSFAAPQRPPLPEVKKAAWPRNAIDRFILARLEAEGLQPAREADRTTLIRRLTLDLTGLPPTLAEVDAFLADTGEQAYERLVDQLLANPHFGERLALDWLDAARFADTHGFHIDSGRDMTRWREWVIDAFNNNKPFDQFTIEQLAGDLLPDATLEQRLATGFHRNHMINFEGGAIPEEYHNAYLVDRVNTTGAVWLGMTVACVQCHDHKYDPISQKEYYQLYAFFHNVPENGLDGSKGNAAPLIRVPSADQQRQLDELSAAIRQREAELAGSLPEVDAAQAAWEPTAAQTKPATWAVLAPDQLLAAEGTVLTVQAEDQSIVASGPAPASETYTIGAPVNLPGITAVRLEALPDERLAGGGPGRSGNGNVVLTEVRVAALAAPGDVAQPVVVQAASADFSQQDFPIANAIDGKSNTGWAVYPEVGKAHTAVLQLAQPIGAPGGVRLQVTLEFQSQYAQHQLGRFRLAVTDSPQPQGTDPLPAAVRSALGIAADQRTPQQRDEIKKYYRERVSPTFQGLVAKLAELNDARAALEKQIPTSMVMQEMAQPRETFVRVRGQYDKLGDKVTAGVPAFLPPLPAGAPHNRLGLAQWLVAPSHPLTARVTVNRYWQMLFGTGLVKTAEDFGSQGEAPSHPALLDWLAVEFQTPAKSPLTGAEQAWNVKALVKQMVMSATYRQSSAVTPELIAKDPENRLLARGPRHRLAAEFIRDQALAISGLLDARIGGPSVSPYQPPGIWEELASRADGKNWTAQEYVQSHGPDLYRRTMYTFWKRTAPPPSLVTFDAPDRETCVVRRARTNTPLQALVLMNDPTYVEAARKLAERLLTQAVTTDERLALAFRLATARPPREPELEALKNVLRRQEEIFRQNADAASRLLGVGESPRDEQLAAVELAAWTMVANAILNLDETLTKG